MTGDARLPAHVEALGLIRQVQAEGGFGTVLHKGDRDAGMIVVVLTENGTNTRAYERVRTLEGIRNWVLVKKHDIDNPQEFVEYLQRRTARDRDLWILELDIANGERLIGLPPPPA